jgi:AcrR family transcriptional regulator
MTTSNSHLATLSPRRCVVCENEDRDTIDRDLIRKRRTQADIARQLGVNRSTISRHYRDHVLPALASAMISSPGDVSIGTMITEFDELYGSNRQIREMAFARDDLRLAKDVNIEQRKLLEVLLKHGEKIGAGSVIDAIGIDRDRWAELDRETKAHYANVAKQYAINFAKAIVTLSELPDDVRDQITKIVLQAEFPDDGSAVVDSAAPEVTGGDPADSEEDQNEDAAS